MSVKELCSFSERGMCITTSTGFPNLCSTFFHQKLQNKDSFDFVFF